MELTPDREPKIDTKTILLKSRKHCIYLGNLQEGGWPKNSCINKKSLLSMYDDSGKLHP